MTKIMVEERHFGSTRDIEGVAEYEFETDTESKDFRKFMEKHRVWDRYLKHKSSRALKSYIADGAQLFSADAYFHGWIYDPCKEWPGFYMCYILVKEEIQPVNVLTAN